MSDSVTDSPTSSERFVDREEAIAEFLYRLHAPEPPQDVLFVHGEGGIGKSLLLDHLQDHYCRALPPSEWEQFVRDFTSLRLRAEQFPARSAHGPKATIALLDFGIERIEDRPWHDGSQFSELRYIRNSLKVPTPTFNAALAGYCYQPANKKIDWDLLSRLVPSANARLGAELESSLRGTNRGLAIFEEALVMLAAGSPLPQVLTATTVRVVWGVAGQLSTPFVERWLKQRALRALPFAEFEQMKPADFAREMPRLLAEDIATALAVEPGRIVLHFDAHNELLKGAENESRSQRRARDGWLRDFLGAATRGTGVVAVVTGQEPPDWGSEVPVRPWPLGYLPPDYAETYLREAGVEPAALRLALAQYAAVEGGAVQPFYLGLLVDAHRETAGGLDPSSFDQNDSVADKQRKILDRLQGAVNDELRAAVKALAACRGFDWELFRGLGERLDFHRTRATFDRLVGLSFVRPEEGANGRYRLHELIRRFLGGEEASAEVRQAALAYFTREGAAETDVAEAVYHEHFLNPTAATTRWATAFSEAVRQSRHAACDALLDVRQVLAERAALLIVMSANQVCEYQCRLFRYDEAAVEFSQALAYWTKRIESVPSDPAAHALRGDALVWGATIYESTGTDAPIDTMYSEAIKAYETALVHSSGDFRAHNNLGVGLAKWGEFRERQRDVEGAIEKYRRARSALEQAIKGGKDPNPGTLNNLGAAIARAADRFAASENDADAEKNYESAVATFDDALRVDPDYAEAHNSRGIALDRWALFRNRRDDPATGRKLSEAIAAFDEALRCAPKFVEAHNNKGIAWRNWALFRHSQGDRDSAVEFLIQSLKALELGSSVRPNPDSFGGIAETAIVLARLANPTLASKSLLAADAAVADWRASFPWDEARIAAVERAIAQVRAKLPPE